MYIYAGCKQSGVAESIGIITAFFARTIRQWNSLDKDIAEEPSLSCFKIQEPFAIVSVMPQFGALLTNNPNPDPGPLVYSPCWRDIPLREFANYLPEPEPEKCKSYLLFVFESTAENWSDTDSLSCKILSHFISHFIRCHVRSFAFRIFYAVEMAKIQSI